MASYQVLISPLFNGPITRLLAFEVDRYNDECARDFVLELLVLWNSMVLINWYFICILASWLVLACSISSFGYYPIRRTRLGYTSFVGVGRHMYLLIILYFVLVISFDTSATLFNYKCVFFVDKIKCIKHNHKHLIALYHPIIIIL